MSRDIDWEHRWENGIDHYPESIELIRKLNDLDKSGEVGLEFGGDGDPGETIAYMLDALIESGIVEIKINDL